MFLRSLSDDFNALFSSRAFQIIVISAISCMFCQLYKFAYYSIKEKRFEWDKLVSTGGFPSSHTALVTTLTMIIGMLQFHEIGYPDWSFAVAAIFAGVTIYDAMGVRYEASKHAYILNKMMLKLTDEEKTDLGFPKDSKLNEMLGHRRVEVLGGLIVGVIVALIAFYIVK